jgi:hypothetical protein
MRPDIAGHDEADSEGLLRYFPVRDGYEVAGQRVGLIALESHAAGRLTFLKSLTDDVDLRTVKPGEVALLERRAKQMGKTDVMKLLQANLAEEEQTDADLSKLAETSINRQAQA